MIYEELILIKYLLCMLVKLIKTFSSHVFNELILIDANMDH